MIVRRILQIIEYKGINKRKFYIETGLSNGFLDKVKDIGASKIEHILNIYPEVSMEWLLTGNGNMLKTDFIKEENRLIHTHTSGEIIDNQYIPLYNTQTTAGVIDLLGKNEEQKPIDYIKIPKVSMSDGALYVVGNSMSPIIENGDIVVYKKILNLENNIIWGEMYIIYVNNDGNEYFFIRYLNQSNRELYVKFVSKNPQHQTIEFPINSIRALAIVKASIRTNTQF